MITSEDIIQNYINRNLYLLDDFNSQFSEVNEENIRLNAIGWIANDLLGFFYWKQYSKECTMELDPDERVEFENNYPIIDKYLNEIQYIPENMTLIEQYLENFVEDNMTQDDM
jgi:hypothetical protein